VSDRAGAPRGQHDPDRALELIHEAHLRPQQVSMDRAAELLSSSKFEGNVIPAPLDSAWPSSRRGAGRPRTNSPWRTTYWKMFGHARARSAGAAQRRLAGAPLRAKIYAAIPELAGLGVPRGFWAGVLARGTIRTFENTGYLKRLASAWGAYSTHAVRIALKRSSLSAHGLGQSEDRIRRMLKALESSSK